MLTARDGFTWHYIIRLLTESRWFVYDCKQDHVFSMVSISFHVQFTKFPEREVYTTNDGRPIFRGPLTASRHSDFKFLF